MIGKRTAARNLDQLATWRLATRSTREGRLGAHRRLRRYRIWDHGNSNKEDAVTVFVSVEAAHLPATIDRRSPLIDGSSQPGRPARTHAHINVTEY
jgi:hypothetical protein